jgi:hypothetical protein
MDLRSKGDTAGALRKLKAANGLVRTPITGLELCKTYLALGQLVEARQTFLSVNRMPVNIEETVRSKVARSESEKLAAQLVGRIPSLRIRITGVPADSVSVTIDGAQVPIDALDAPRRLCRPNEPKTSYCAPSKPRSGGSHVVPA